MNKVALASSLALLSSIGWAQVYTDSNLWPPKDSEYVQTSGGDKSPEGFSIGNLVLGNPTGTPVALKKGLNAVNVKLAFVLEGDEGTPDGKTSHSTGQLDLSGSVTFLSATNTSEEYGLSIDSFEGSTLLWRFRKRPEILSAKPFAESAKIIMDRDTGRSRMSSAIDIDVDVQTDTGAWSELSSPLHLEMRGTATPEPVTLSALGLGCLAFLRRKRAA